MKYTETPVVEINSAELDRFGVTLLIKREDLNHPLASGNKWWKLKNNLKHAKDMKENTLLTFGGAYSNHIYATAAAAKEDGFKAIGVIRGEETLPLNFTLSFARTSGMHLHYVSREEYRHKHEHWFNKNLEQHYGNFYCIPEGGSNTLAVEGMKEFTERYLNQISCDYVCCPVGTGGTIAGIVAGSKTERQVIGFSAIKGGNFLVHDVQNFIKGLATQDTPAWTLELDYHHGGYAKLSPPLLAFMENFEEQHGFQLDPVYTGKMMFGIFDLVKKGRFNKGSTILAIHTGGLQGWQGMNERSLR